MKWTSEERALLRKNQSRSVAISVTAAQLKRSVRAVASYACTHGILQPHWTRENVRQALEMKEFGKTSREIGAVVGKTAANVRRMFWRRRRGQI